MTFLLLLQLAATWAAVAAAAWDVETIVASGPLLSLTGAALAAFCYRRGRPLSLYFSLSAPTVSVLCFGLIYGFQWSPGEAQSPIPILSGVYAWCLLPLGVLAAREMNRSAAAPRCVKLQFRLRSIFGLMFAVSVLLGAIRFDFPPLTASTVVVVYLALLVWILKRFHQARGETTRRQNQLLSEAANPFCSPAEGAGP